MRRGLYRWGVGLILSYCLWGTVAMAGGLTVEQRVRLKADMLETPLLAAAISDEHYDEIVRYYNAVARPSFWLWRTAVPPEEYTGPEGIDWEDLLEHPPDPNAALLFHWYTRGLTRPLNATEPVVRQMLAKMFPAKGETRRRLLTMLRREATRGEQVVASGAGSLIAPAIPTWEGLLTRDDVAAALLMQP